MAKVKVTVHIDPLKFKLLHGFVNDKATGNKIGRFTVDQIRKLTSVGKSPVRGVGRFKPYVEQREPDHPNPYPKSVRKSHPSKKVRPVNLRLNGAMMKALGFISNKSGVTVGFAKASDLIKKIFDAHNHGTLKAKNVPERKFLPTSRGEEFTPRLTKGIKDIYVLRIKSIIKEMNRK